MLARPDRDPETAQQIFGHSSKDITERTMPTWICSQPNRTPCSLSVEQGDRVLYPDIRYFFYITNDRTLSAEDVVFSCNDRCDQAPHQSEEGLIEQLSNGPRAFQAPVLPSPEVECGLDNCNAAHIASDRM